MDLRGSGEDTGARGGKASKRRRKAGKSAIWRRKETNVLPKRSKTGSDGRIRLILGLISSARGVGKGLSKGLSKEILTKSTQIHQNPSIWTVSKQLRRVLRGPNPALRQQKEGKSSIWTVSKQQKEGKASYSRAKRTNLLISPGSRVFSMGFRGIFPRQIH